jgi:hypothetical protein
MGMKDYKDSFMLSIENISNIFRQYSIKDIAESLFVSNIWLPNIASPVTHQFFTAIFASINPEEFSNEDLVKAYNDFTDLIGKLYGLRPSFSLLEDFVPEPDWGEIKFHHENINYKIFYGSELSNVYEYLSLFQMLYLPYESEYKQQASRSPKNELRYSLKLQQEIIDGITSQFEGDNIRISPGYVEIPPVEFWRNAQSFYSSFKPDEICSKAFIENFSIKLGDFQKESLNIDIFSDKIFNGTLLQSFFLKHGSHYLPILPRRYSSILFDKWSEVFRKHEIKVANGRKYIMNFAGQLYRYINGRLMADNIFALASAITEQKDPHEVIFPVIFISKNKLIIIYLTEPSLSSKKIARELEETAFKLNEALRLLSIQPMTLALHADRQNVQFESKLEKIALKPELIVLVPQVSTQYSSIRIPKTLPGRVMLLDEFLGIIDELEYVDTLSDFFDYLSETENTIQSGLSMLDKFASFKDSYGILIEGALQYDHISLDPHWGSRRRYQTLAEFWKKYPEIGFFDHPRTWKLTQETETRIRFEARGYVGSALYFKIGKSNIYLTAPFKEMNYNQADLSNLLMESLEDSMSIRRYLIKHHNFFKYHDCFQVNFFPLSLVAGNEKFKHLNHLCNIEKYFSSDMGMPLPGKYMIRTVFDDIAVTKGLTNVKDCSFQVDILQEILKQLNNKIDDPYFENMLEDIEKTRSGKPRFGLFSMKKPVSFPELIAPLEPKPAHFKKAKKQIAKLTANINLMEGEYKLEEAKEIINKLRDEVVAEINSEVNKYNFASVIPFLLKQIDALDADYQRHRYMIQQGINHDIDYQVDTSYAEQHTEFTKKHKTYRYLIEKFVQLEPKGEVIFGKDQFQYLIALIDWLHVFYSASDNLHYGILPVGIRINRDFLVDVLYEVDMDSKQKEFSKYMAQLELGLIGNHKDKVDNPTPIEKFLKKLDKAFIIDLGFSFKSMINVLQILSMWPTYEHTVEESTSYSALYQDIENICMKNIISVSKIEIPLIVDFLTLKKDDVIRILGQDDPCPDLPVWEYRKRYARYNLRPLIKVGNKLHWGPYSTRKSGLIWSGVADLGMTPADIQAITVVEMIREEKKLIEDGLEDKALEIMGRSTSYVRKNLQLHNLAPKGSHPLDLGDFDILSFYSEKNIVFNIECKDILPAYCLKDAKRLREKIFGAHEKDKGHFEQIDKRKDYLEKNIFDISRALEWPVKPNNPPKIITIYLSRRSYWWTIYPPVKTEVVFLQIEMLSDFIRDID